ncbi:MAG: two pore domain potassium channel family protein [Muribaculaceae bacterium]|nr:two pore domain potassium channel family protein [Muribaculaceae bacterium]
MPKQPHATSPHQGTTARMQVSPWLRITVAAARLLLIAASVWMIAWITRDTISDINLLASAAYMRFQFWVCIFFLSVSLLELYAAGRGNRLAWFRGHWLFVLVSIPWLTLVQLGHVHLSANAQFLIRFIPMIRAGYVLALITGTLSASRAVSIMKVYAMWVAASVYFASLVFFVEAHPVNPQVDSWWSALGWASLCLTTVGSPINALTATGRVLAVVVSGEGLMLLPVFTVYITHMVTSHTKSQDDTTAADITASDAEAHDSAEKEQEFV